MARAIPVRAIRPRTIGLSWRWIELNDFPETTMHFAVPLGMLLFVECDLGLDVHGFSLSAALLANTLIMLDILLFCQVLLLRKGEPMGHKYKPVMIVPEDGLRKKIEDQAKKEHRKIGPMALEIIRRYFIERQAGKDAAA